MLHTSKYHRKILQLLFSTYVFPNRNHCHSFKVLFQQFKTKKDFFFQKKKRIKFSIQNLTLLSVNILYIEWCPRNTTTEQIFWPAFFFKKSINVFITEYAQV